MAARPSRPRELYRDPDHGKIAGICAGIGRYFNWPVWPIRLALVLLAVFTQFFPMAAVYLIAWFVLDPLSDYSPPGLRGQLDGWVRHTRSRWDQDQYTPAAADAEYAQPEPGGKVEQPVFAAGSSAREPVPPDAFSVEAAFAELEQRVQRIERHVTEPAFVLRQQFRSL